MLITEAQHWTGKRRTRRIERQNLNFRTHLKSLQQRSVGLSMSAEMNQTVMKLQIKRHNCRHRF